MAGQISGVGLGLVATGGLLIYSGLFNQPVGTILRGVIHGQAPTQGPPVAYTANQVSTDTTGATRLAVPAPAASSASSAANQAIARLAAAPYGWSIGQEWDSLVALWNQESGWSSSAFNPSGAYGVAQALGHAGPGESAIGPRTVGATGDGLNSAYGGYGLSTAQAQAANAGHAAPQIAWGLAYIQANYGDPIAAEQHELANSWY